MLGTIIVALPLGVMAGIYLTEYARDNWFTRAINLAIVNLAGVPSIVYGLFGLGVFVLMFHFGMSLLVSQPHLSLPGAGNDRDHFEGSDTGSTQGIQGRQSGNRGHQVADNQTHGITAGFTGNHHRGSPGNEPCCRRNSTDTGRRSRLLSSEIATISFRPVYGVALPPVHGGSSRSRYAQEYHVGCCPGPAGSRPIIQCSGYHY